MHVCSEKAEFSFSQKKTAFLIFLQTCTKLTFGLSNVLVITVIARNTINSFGSLFFSDRILSFGKNMPWGRKRFLSNFNVVAIQNSLNGFRNTLNVRNNNKASRWYLLIRSVTRCSWLRSVETLGLWIVTSWLHSFNYYELQILGYIHEIFKSDEHRTISDCPHGGHVNLDIKKVGKHAKLQNWGNQNASRDKNHQFTREKTKWTVPAFKVFKLGWIVISFST